MSSTSSANSGSRRAPNTSAAPAGEQQRRRFADPRTGAADHRHLAV
ncbi:hypothetical protein M5585_19640 [Serratia ureilytica]